MASHHPMNPPFKHLASIVFVFCAFIGTSRGDITSYQQQLTAEEETKALRSMIAKELIIPGHIIVVETMADNAALPPGETNKHAVPTAFGFLLNTKRRWQVAPASPMLSLRDPNILSSLGFDPLDAKIEAFSVSGEPISAAIKKLSDITPIPILLNMY